MTEIEQAKGAVIEAYVRRSYPALPADEVFLSRLDALIAAVQRAGSAPKANQICRCGHSSDDHSQGRGRCAVVADDGQWSCRCREFNAAASEAHAPTAEPVRVLMDPIQCYAHASGSCVALKQLAEKDAEIARLRDEAAVFAADAAAPTCQHCGLPLTCSSERAELIHGLQQMYAETLTRAEQAEAALAALEPTAAAEEIIYETQ